MKNTILIALAALLPAIPPAVHADTAAQTSPAPATSAAPPATPALTDASLRALTRDEARTLSRIIRLSPAQLASLRQSIDALEKMTPAERQELARKLDAMRGSRNGAGAPPRGGPGGNRGFGAGPDGERPHGAGPRANGATNQHAGPPAGRAAAPGTQPQFGETPPPPRNNAIFRYWRSLPPERAREEQEKFQKMSIAERRAYAREVFRKLPRPPRPDHAPEGPKPPARQPSPDGASGD